METGVGKTKGRKAARWVGARVIGIGKRAKREKE